MMKTRDAELRAYSKLSNETKDSIIPIFELTKSRKSTRAPDGDIHRKMSYLRDVVGNRPFVLDITQVEKYSNTQIENLLEENNGFYEWQFFLRTYDDLNIIPTIHVYDDDELEEVGRFVSWASQNYKKLALIVPSDVENISNLLTFISEHIQKGCTLLFFVDAGFVPEEKQTSAIKALSLVVEEASEVIEESNIVIISTTFPQSVVSMGRDDSGEFEIRELGIFNAIADYFPIQYGDYASINPLQYEMRGGTWVPRVDVSLSNNYIYTRYRREHGGYIVAANKMLANKDYVSINCWGDDEIRLAASGNPGGKSPSYWISVRMNIHMSRRASEFKGK
jgi:hypothetical protein